MLKGFIISSVILFLAQAEIASIFAATAPAESEEKVDSKGFKYLAKKYLTHPTHYDETHQFLRKKLMEIIAKHKCFDAISDGLLHLLFTGACRDGNKDEFSSLFNLVKDKLKKKRKYSDYPNISLYFVDAGLEQSSFYGHAEPTQVMLEFLSDIKISSCSEMIKNSFLRTFQNAIAKKRESLLTLLYKSKKISEYIRDNQLQETIDLYFLKNTRGSLSS